MAERCMGHLGSSGAGEKSWVPPLGVNVSPCDSAIRSLFHDTCIGRGANKTLGGL